MSSVTDKIDQLLKEDSAFTTRAGLRFLLELVSDAFKYIESEKQQQTDIDERLTHVETKLEKFIADRKEEQRVAAEERIFYRRAVIGGVIAILLNELARWFLHYP